MSKSALTKIGNRAWSYETAILDVLPDGRTIGNLTKYSVTTSKHQRQAEVHTAEVKVSDVPQGTTNLSAWYLARCEALHANQ